MIASVVAGFAIGIVTALPGAAGSEIPIRTLVLPFGVDVKLAGSLSLAESLPTMLVGVARYGRDRGFVVLGENRRFVLVMAAGSVFGSSIITGRQLNLNAVAQDRELRAFSHKLQLFRLRLARRHAMRTKC